MPELATEEAHQIEEASSATPAYYRAASRHIAEHRQLEAILDGEHWVKWYITRLMMCVYQSELTFERARLLLDQQEKDLEGDMKIARRMYKLYPEQVTAPE